MKKDLILLLCVVLLAVLLIRGIDIKSVDEYYLLHAEDVHPGDPTVTLVIDCTEAVGAGDRLPERLLKENYLPEDGMILSPTEFVLREGDSAFDLFLRAARVNRIQTEYQGAKEGLFGGAYIKGISHLYEFDCGPSSGWTFLVNGKQTEVSCSAYEPAAGDVLTWKYVTEPEGWG